MAAPGAAWKSGFPPAGRKMRMWSPPQSPVRIEYAAGLLRETRAQGFSGALYGLKSDREIRVVAARGDRDARDAALDRLEAVGIFAVRERGEVFLTEQDLERFERASARVALVIAGSKAGFFVHDQDGSLQSIQSYQELPCPVPLRRRWRTSRASRWAGIPGVAAAIVAGTLSACSMLRNPEMAITVRQDSGQLRVAWSSTRGTLQIVDGANTTSIRVVPGFSTLTYMPGGEDIQIRLVSGDKIKTVRFVDAGAAR